MYKIYTLANLNPYNVFNMSVVCIFYRSHLHIRVHNSFTDLQTKPLIKIHMENNKNGLTDGSGDRKAAAEEA